MPTGRQGSIHLFRYAGVDVFLHWSWFIFAVFEINRGIGRYSSALWNVLEYLSLFLIVLLHEFGHSLACRQVGGIADHIVLWPLGGVAYVNPPPRPGPTLWSLAAGPLVNVVLFPVLLVLSFVLGVLGSRVALPNAWALLRAVSFINAMLLIFNLLPVFPLDGGQILRALLWYPLGRARSLLVATIIGFIGVAGLIFFALRAGSVWFAVLSVFILLNCWGGLKQSLVLLRLAKIPRREGYACPWCKVGPPLGSFWRCANCHQGFDTFESQGVCPYCRTQFAVTRCFDCGSAHPISEWVVPTYVVHKV